MEGRLCGLGTDKRGEGFQNPRNLADVICACPLYEIYKMKKFEDTTESRASKCLNTTHALKSCRWSFMPLTVEKISNKFKIGSRLQCNCTRPIYTPTHITDVPTSCFLCCSYFLFELMYILPVWVVSAFSCLR